MQDKKLYLRRETTEIRGWTACVHHLVPVRGLQRLFLPGTVLPGKVSIRTELFLLVLAFDLKKLWMKREPGRLRTHASLKMTL